MQTASTTLGYLRPVLRLLQENGQDISALLQSYDIPVSGLLDSAQRIPVTLSRQIMELAARHCSPTPLWKALLKHTHYHDFGGLGLALEAGGNPATVLQRVVNYHALVSDAVSMTITTEANACRLNIALSPLHPPHPQSILFLLALFAYYSRTRGDQTFYPQHIGVMQVSGQECEALRQFCACPVVMARDFYIQFAGADSQRPLKDSDTEIAATLDSVLQKRLQSQTRTYAALLQQWLRLNMGDTTPRLCSAARAMHMSERSLQRRLQAEGVSWTSLVESTRQQVMDPMLLASGIPITEVALTLGYTHATSFSRAFRKRHGTTPRNYRKQRAKATNN